jgi:hypothetical protein
MAPFSADLPNCGCLTDVRHDTGKRCHPESPRLASRVIPRSVSDEGSAVENTDGRMA